METSHLFKIIELLKSNDEESRNLGMKLLKEHKNEFGKKAKYYYNEKVMPIRSFPFRKVLLTFSNPYNEDHVSGRFKNFNVWNIDLKTLENAIYYQEQVEKNASERRS